MANWENISTFGYGDKVTNRLNVLFDQGLTPTDIQAFKKGQDPVINVPPSSSDWIKMGKRNTYMAKVQNEYIYWTANNLLRKFKMPIEEIKAKFKPLKFVTKGTGDSLTIEYIKKEKNGLFDQIGNFFEDIGKGIAYLAVAPINSVTGHQWDPEFETDVGGIISAGAAQGIDSIHIIGKTFADTITLGYASKAVNLVRDKEDQESYGNYNEMDAKFEDVKLIGKLEEYSKKGAVVVGQYLGGQAMDSDYGEIVQTVVPVVDALVNPQDQERFVEVEQKGSVPMLLILMVGLILILK